MKGVIGDYKLFKKYKNFQYVGITKIHFSSKNQNIPMNKSEEKLRKPHFLAFLRGLRGLEGIKNC